MPLQGARKPILIVEIHGTVETAPKRERDEKMEGQNRFGIVDAPSAHDHDDHGERVEPMGDPHGQRMYDHLRDVVQTSGRDVSHCRLPSACASAIGASPADLNAACAAADLTNAMNGWVSDCGSRACATTYSIGGWSSSGSGTNSLKPAVASVE